MSTESFIAVGFILAVFVSFAAVLAWGERQTRLVDPASHGRKRRPF